jgi:hypothetical protein
MKRLPCLLAAALAAAPFPAAAGVRAVWAVTDGEKIAHDARDHPLRGRNAAWDGRTVRLFAARNEVVAYQVIVEADERGIGAASLALPELRLRGGTARIAYAAPEADPTRSVGRPIQLFSVNDMKVAQESHADWVWTPGSPAAPKGTLGFKPVQLIPENARAGRGGFPVRVSASESQAFWIEVYTGRGRPAGSYEGTVTVTADGSTHGLPLELRLFGFDLPDQNSLDAMVFFEPDQPELYQGRRLDAAYHRFAHRHRVELVHAYDEAKVRASLSRFTGADFRPEAGYEGPGEGVGNRIVPVSFYGPGPEYAQRESAWRAADAWMGFLQKTVPGARTFLYLPDEPYPQDYPRVRAFAENVRSNPGPGRSLPLFLTKNIIPEFQGLVDLWSVPPQALDLKAAADEQAKGRHMGFYNGGRPNGPSIVIDAPATEARVVPWAAFKHGFDLYFFWHGVHWRHNRQKQGERNQDVWRNPITFDNRGQPGKPVADQGYINGDGVLLYPGEEKLHPEEDRGIAGPISTVQLANLRRGLQDHQYLTLARGLGLEAEVQAAVQAIVPHVFSDAGPSVSFPESGEAFEAARLKLAEAIESKGQAVAPRPPMPKITKPVMFDTPEADRILVALQVFPPDNPWNQDVSQMPVHGDSAKMLASIGPDKPLEYNLDMGFILVPPDQPPVPVKILLYPAESDPGPFPVPDNAPIENWPLQKNEDKGALPRPGQTLAQLQREGTGDRHVILVDPVNGKLHELWQGRKTDAGWEAANAATFDLKSGALRPEGWTSSDAAGLPIFPAVVRYDECARGMVEHAMRFTVRRTRRGYVLPATHWASPSKDPSQPRMGERFRLRRDFDLSGFPPHVQAILKGLKKYGMFVADNGSDWYMSIAPDRRLSGLETLHRLKGSDFEVVETGARSVEAP